MTVTQIKFEDYIELTYEYPNELELNVMETLNTKPETYFPGEERDVCGVDCDYVSSNIMDEYLIGKRPVSMYGLHRIDNWQEIRRNIDHK